MSLTAETSDHLQSQFQDDGYLIVRGLFATAELIPAIAESERLLARKDLIDFRNLRCRWQNHCQTGECRFDAFDPITDLSPPIARLARDVRLLAVLEQVYGEPAYLFKDKLIYKPPGATGYGLHQDYIAWPGFPRSFLSVLVPLDAATRANGCTVVYLGRYEDVLSAADGDYHELPQSTVEESTAVALELEPGDVALFGGFVPHRSDANNSPEWRRQLYLSYNALSDGGDQRDAHYREFHAWLRKKYAEFDRHETWFD
ncbi:MAG TPA: phytanoyl-CoA dioxygenase family protein [Planctomycetaceae bacterium]|nr:phytanoyl-CoA dioxygenase family protein [Planctomycetaceae bacterium]